MSSNFEELNKVISVLSTYLAVFKIDYYVMLSLLLKLSNFEVDRELIVNHLITVLTRYVEKLRKFTQFCRELDEVRVFLNFVYYLSFILEEECEKLRLTYMSKSIDECLNLVRKVYRCLKVIDSVLELIRKELENFILSKLGHWLTVR